MASMLAACTGAVVATIAGMLHLGGIGLVAGGLIGATIGLLATMKLRLKQVK
ncbi:hypothetical protein D3C80_2228150 [compost metagenome]